MLILLASSNGVAQTSPVLISGFDDVLRQAENTGLVKAGFRLFREDRGFTGMPELYQYLTDSEPDLCKFAVISAISSMFESRVDAFLAESHYPCANVYLRSWLTEWSIEKFKIEKIQKVLSDHPNRPVILVLDNSAASQDLTKTLLSQNAKHQYKIYLHRVVDISPPPGAQSFITAFDIAVSEFRAGHLDAQEVNQIAAKIETEKQSTDLLPEYAFCPKTYQPCGSQPESSIQVSCLAVANKVTSICHTRP